LGGGAEYHEPTASLEYIIEQGILLAQGAI
jgi:hypothetical protein